MAFGRAAGLDEAWLRSLFAFAPEPDERVYVNGKPAAGTAGQGFLEFTCRRLGAMEARKSRQDLLTRTQARLKAARQRTAGARKAARRKKNQE
jgi:hypothetical protein